MLLFRRSLLSHALVAAFALIVGLAATPAQAQKKEHESRDQPPPGGRPPRDGDTLSDAVRRIERANRGEVLSAERMQYDGREVNRIKVMDDQGRVRVYMDAPQQPTRSNPPQPRDNNDRPPRPRDDD